MADPTREEYNAKLEAVEARLETKLVGIDGKLDRLADQLAGVAASATEAKTAAERARDVAGNIKWNIAFTALALIGVIFAMWTIWAQAVEMTKGLLG